MSLGRSLGCAAGVDAAALGADVAAAGADVAPVAGALVGAEVGGADAGAQALRTSKAAVANTRICNHL